MNSILCVPCKKTRKRPQCLQPDCETLPVFNFGGETKALYCCVHKLMNMVNIKSKTCIEPDCETQPVFNFVGQTKRLYCSIHKKESMVNITSKTCIEPNCVTVPNFNLSGEANALYCNIHKKMNMVNVKDKTCIEHGCSTRSNFNIRGQTKRLYCSVHKKEDMVNLTSKACIEPNCVTGPSFNFSGEAKALYCTVHKKMNMVNVKDKICTEPGCITRSNFNLCGQTGTLYCSVHKKESMVDITHKACLTPLCEVQISNKLYEGYCARCFMFTFPDKPVARNYKTKERATVEFVLEHFSGFTWITDKKVDGGCSRRRPDLILDLGYQVVIVEIDENQHTDYACENRRIMEISQDIGHRPLVMIRFNPDDYIFKENGKVTSCWGINGHGVCGVKKTMQKEWLNRLSSLKEQIIYWSEPAHKIDKTIEIIQLFYDEN